jgi:hypothetical protein
MLEAMKHINLTATFVTVYLPSDFLNATKMYKSLVNNVTNSVPLPVILGTPLIE